MVSPSGGPVSYGRGKREGFSCTGRSGPGSWRWVSSCCPLRAHPCRRGRPRWAARSSTRSTPSSTRWSTAGSSPGRWRWSSSMVAWWTSTPMARPIRPPARRCERMRW